MSCFYCEKNEVLDSLMIEICELEESIVYLNKDQKHKGRCIVAYKNHKTEYFELTKEENAQYFAEVSLVAKAVFELYHPDKINYATFGDGVPHVHMHIVPKYKNGLQWGQAYDDGVPKEFLGGEKYEEMITEIKEKIDELRK